MLGLLPVLAINACSETEEPAVRAVTRAVVEEPLSIRLPAGLDPELVALGAGDELRINDGVTVTGLASSTGAQTTNIGVSAVVREVVSVPNVLLRNNALVQGDVFSAGTVTLSFGASVAGNIHQNEDLGALEERLLTPPAGESSGDVILQSGQSYVLAPGRYATVSLAAGSTLRVSAGVYRFQNLYVQPSSTVSVDHAAGAVGVYVDAQVTFNGTITTADISEHPQFALIALGTGDVNVNSAFVGALLAPRAKISLASVGGAGHRGQFIGRSVEVHQHQTIHYEPFEHWESIWDLTEDEALAEPGEDLSDAFGNTVADEAMLRFIAASFENDDETEYAAARAGVLALPTGQAVGSLTSAFGNLESPQFLPLVLFTAGLIQDPSILPLYRSVLDAPVPPEVLDPNLDPHDELGGAQLFALHQSVDNLAVLHAADIAGARALLLDALSHPMPGVRSFAVFRIKSLFTIDPTLEADLLSRLLPGDGDFLDIEAITDADLELPEPPPEELDPDFEMVPRGPSPGGSLPDCENGAHDPGETDVDCGGPCEACPLGGMCAEDDDCQNGLCIAGTCGEANSGGDCVDLGSDGNNVTVSTNACIRVQDAYPSWWGTRTMQLQTTTPGNYPVPFTWFNSCAGGNGAGQFTSDWQNQFIGPTNSQCATIIQFAGSPTGTITLRYYGP